MKRSELLKEISEVISENQKIAESMIGKSIISSINYCINQKINIKEVKTIAESMLYLTEQIETLNTYIYNINMLSGGKVVNICDNNDYQALIRQREKYYESLKKCINEL
jgi:hypothetical protein